MPLDEREHVFRRLLAIRTPVVEKLDDRDCSLRVAGDKGMAVVLKCLAVVLDRKTLAFFLSLALIGVEGVHHFQHELGIGDQIIADDLANRFLLHFGKDIRRALPARTKEHSSP